MPIYAPSVANTANRNNVSDGIERPSHVDRSLFREDTSSAKEFGSSDGPSGSAVGKLLTENEMIVNKFLHANCHGFVDRFNISDKDESSIKVCALTQL
jgi:hypothetical protein